MRSEHHNELLVRLARAVGPHWRRFVVVGGAAHQLFRRSPLAQPVDFGVLRTLDADIAVDPEPSASELRLDRELEQLGFRAEMSGAETPPVTRYVLSASPSHFIQFIAHRRGSGQRRDGRRASTAQIAGAVVENLPHVDLLLREPWELVLRPELGFPDGDDSLRLHIANPASYLAQKLLVLDRRDAEHRAKDLVYVHDTLLIFAPHLSELAALWSRVEPARSKRRSDLDSTIVQLNSRRRDDLFRAVELIRSIGQRDIPEVRAFATTLDIGLRSVFLSG